MDIRQNILSIWKPFSWTKIRHWLLVVFHTLN